MKTTRLNAVTNRIHTEPEPQQLPPRYNPPATFDQPDTTVGISTAELADRHLAAVRELTAVTQAALAQHEAGVAALKQAADAEDKVALKAAMDSLWEQVYATYRALDTLSVAWNDLAPRAAVPRQ